MNNHLLLADFIYQLNTIEWFRKSSSLWSSPMVEFYCSECKSIEEQRPKFISKLKEKKIIREDLCTLICILCDWDVVAEGIFFTSKAIYVSSPKNKTKNFRIRYDDITKMTLFKSSNELIVNDYRDKSYTINSKLWNAHAIHLFLEFASQNYAYDEQDKKRISDLTLENCNSKSVGEIIAGDIYGNVSSGATIYGETKFHSSRGHGFAAERANCLLDKVLFDESIIVGDDNIKNGPDRQVNNVKIQSKYCKTGSKCISDCFTDGKFRYINPDGTPMQIEVPSDKYDAALAAMKNRIQKGQIPGVTDPDDAILIVRKGHFTYEQVRNIAKAGTIESICYDAVNGAIIASCAFGITATISFATSLWNGEKLDTALKNSAMNGLKVGGTTFATAIFAGQLTKAGMNSLLVGSTDAVIKFIGPKGAAILANAFRSGTSIYGAAAMKSASKMLRGNVITATVSAVILSTGDVIDIFRGRISGPQLVKNVASTCSSVAGGTAGWIGGAAAGAALGTVVPVIGNAVGATVGGVIGAFCGGTAAGSASSAAMNLIIEDDSKEIILIIEQSFLDLANEHLLTQREVEHTVDHLGEALTNEDLKKIFASTNREALAKQLIIPHVQRELSRRRVITTPNDQALLYGLSLWINEQAEYSEEATPQFC
ncbi:hypothetical protein [Desulfovibrio cuneatus]|uniref:hypothetical protein n=1 Tax=Desulfovibrio cuneatus TaxID=159728 RepID=UPI0004284086|nr:hypothetical protein [Desulfovibrio cuneatus]